MSQYISVDTADGSFSAYIARPKTMPAAVVIVVHDVFGVDVDMINSCDDLASLGYLAVSPNLFWRQESGVEAADAPAAFDYDTAVADIAATMTLARVLPGANGKVGLLGFGLGGLMTFLATARIGTMASVVYYGERMQEYLEESANIRTPLTIHLAADDELIAEAAQRTIADAFVGDASAQIFTYAGCRHAFARRGGAHYDREAATLAVSRTSEFFLAHLVGGVTASVEAPSGESAETQIVGSAAAQ